MRDGNDNGCAIKPSEISAHLERQGSERGAYKVDKGDATPPAQGKWSHSGEPMPRESKDSPGV